MKRRILLLGLVLCVGCDAASDVTVPPGTSPLSLPTPSAPLREGLLAFDSDRSGSFELYLMEHDGSGARALTNDPRTDSWWPRISPDRTQILYYRTPAGVHDTDFTKTSLWMIASDGSEEVELLPSGSYGWDVQGHAEWSPDGETLVMFAGTESNPQIFLTAKSGRDPRQITERGGVSLDPSFAPDGETIYFIGCPRSICFPSDYEMYSMRPGEEPIRLTNDDLRDHDPYVSPDGSSVAWLTMSSSEGPHGTWGIQLADADGSNSRWVIDDGNINSKPDWNEDGTTIWFHRLVYGEDDSFSVYSISPDGAELTEVTAGQPGVNEFPDAG